MHLKRNKFEKFWPVPRKGAKYLAVSTHNQRDSIPLIVVMRDIFKIVKNKKELKKALNKKQIKINHKEIKEANHPVCLFDIISLPNIRKNYRATLSEHKKMVFEEISDKETETKILKIIGKKVLKDKKIQLNLVGGRNLISKEKADMGDSVVLNLKENKILKVISLEKGKKVFVIHGGHAGIKGKIEEIMLRGGKKIAKIKVGNKNINVWTKNIVLIE